MHTSSLSNSNGFPLFTQQQCNRSSQIPFYQQGRAIQWHHLDSLDETKDETPVMAPQNKLGGGSSCFPPALAWVSSLLATM